MTVKEAKAELRTVQDIDRLIRRLMQSRDEQRAALLKITASLDADRVQSYSDGHSLERGMERIMQLEDRINGEVDRLIATKDYIYRKLAKVKNNHQRELLEMRYILGFSWERIAEGLCYTERQTFRLHGYALQSYARVEL